MKSASDLNTSQSMVQRNTSPKALQPGRADIVIH